MDQKYSSPANNNNNNNNNNNPEINNTIYDDNIITTFTTFGKTIYIQEWQVCNEMVMLTLLRCA